MLSVSIEKRLGNFLLDVSFITCDETMALLGASGCGKSMTLKCIAGIEMPDYGRIVLNDRVLFDSERGINLSPQQRHVGYLFQQYALFPNMTVLQNIISGCRVGNKADKRDQAEKMIKSMRLQGLEEKRPGQLSGGQQQRVALARILVNDPDLLLLDEPFTALDSYLKWQLELELADTIHEYGQGAIFVSHSREEVYRLCDSVCVLHEGKSETKQSVQELFSRPQTIAAAELTGCSNFSPIKVIGEKSFVASNWGVELSYLSPLENDITHIGVAARQIKLSATPKKENSFAVRVERIIEDIGSYRILLRTPGGDVVYSELDKKIWLGLREQDALYAVIDPERFMLLRER